MRARPVSTPCINICKMDRATGWCLGCGRTLQEVAAWSAMTEPERRRVMEGLSARLTRLPKVRGRR